MKGKLIEDLGQDYVDNMWHEAMFVAGDRLHIYVGSGDEEGYIRTKCLKLDGTSSKYSSATVPTSVFESMATFAWPKLGYRNIPHDKYGSLVYYVTSTRSAMRGLRDTQLVFDAPPIHMIDPFACDARESTRSYAYLPQIFNPTFPPLSEAIGLLTSGERGAVAISEDIAIGINCTTNASKAFDVYFKQRVIGSMASDGSIEIANKIIKRSAMAKLLNREGFS